MEDLPLGKAFTLIEPGQVILVTTHDGHRDNVMTVSWTMVLDFTARLALTTGAWNYSYAALTKTRECVIAMPTIDLLDTAVGVDTCPGADTDKFARFGLTRRKARHVHAPLIAECLANIECRVADITLVDTYNLFILRAVRIWTDPKRKERRTLHHNGEGTFTVDGKTIDLKNRMVLWKQFQD